MYQKLKELEAKYFELSKKEVDGLLVAIYLAKLAVVQELIAYCDMQ